MDKLRQYSQDESDMLDPICARRLKYELQDKLAFKGHSELQSIFNDGFYELEDVTELFSNDPTPILTLLSQTHT
jgi:hypothetical protein